MTMHCLWTELDMLFSWFGPQLPYIMVRCNLQQQVQVGECATCRWH